MIKNLAKKIKRVIVDKPGNKRMYARLESLIEETQEIKDMFSYEQFAKHYVYEPSRQTVDHPDIFINQVRYFRMYEYFKNHYPDVFYSHTKVADFGDTSGLLFRAMKREGTSVNINQDVIDYIKSFGVEALIGDVEDLPFKDNEFDYSFCFQCLEHLPNPIKALSEIGRVTQKKIFISIPYVKQTRIYDNAFWVDLKMKSVEEGGWNEREVRDVDGHKFEFSAQDFKKIASHAKMECIDHYPINYFSPLGTNRKNEGTYFNFFILRPTEKKISKTQKQHKEVSI